MRIRLRLLSVPGLDLISKYSQVLRKASCAICKDVFQGFDTKPIKQSMPHVVFLVEVSGNPYLSVPTVAGFCTLFLLQNVGRLNCFLLNRRFIFGANS